MSGFRSHSPPPDPTAGLVAGLFEHFEVDLAGRQLPPYLARLLGRFRELPFVDQRAEVGRLYLCFEEYLSDVCGARRHSRAHLRSIVRARFRPLLDLPELSLIFADPDEQHRRLGEMFRDRLLAEAGPVVGAGAGHVSIQAEIERIYLALEAAKGEVVAERVFESVLASLSRRYRALEPALIELVPEKLLDEERARTLAARRRESAFGDRFAALKRVHEKLQTRVAELDREKGELLATVSSSARSASLFGTVMELAEEGVVMVDRRGRIVQANRASLDMWGHHEEDVVGKDLGMLFPDAAKPGRLDELRRFLATGTPGSFGERLVLEARRRDGTTFPARVRATETTPAGERSLYALVVRDLTEFRRAEAQIGLQAAALRSSASGIAIVDTLGQIEWTNPSFDALTGHGAGELTGTSIAGLIDIDEEPPEASWTGERAVRRKDGTTYVARLVVSPVRDDAERIVHLVIHHDDVTSEKRARDALGRSEASFRALIEESPDAIIVARGGRIVFVNAAAVTSLGYSRRDDLIGRAVEDIFPPRDRVATGLSILRMEAQGMPLAPRETTLCRRDGTAIEADVVGLSVTFNGAPAAVLIARDISGRKRLQAGLAIADRMVALGTLVDEVRPGAREPGRKEPSDKWPSVELGRVLDASIHLMGGHLRRGARLIKSYGTTPLVRGSETRLAQVFLNLLLNTAEGIPAGEAERHTIEVRTGTDDRGRAEIEIRDEFAGSPGDLGPVGGARPGRGLGLSIAQNIVASLGGEIEVAGEPGAPPIVRIFLPPAQPDPD